MSKNRLMSHAVSRPPKKEPHHTGGLVLVKYHIGTFFGLGYVKGMVKRRSSREARTRGPDLSAPLNRPTIETPGYAVPKERRTRRDLLGEHRIQMLAEAKELGRLGATDFEVAEHFNVAPSTIHRWIVADKSFADALKLGDSLADSRVERALYHKALGYTYRSEDIKVIDGTVVRVPTTVHVPPDNTAMIFWLKNRMPADWRDQKDVNFSGEVKTDNDDPRRLAMALMLVLSELMGEGIDPSTIIEHEDQREAAE